MTTLTFVNEIPKGSSIKYAIDANNNLWVERILKLPCPHNYGFIEGYIGEDGEPLDAFLVNFNYSLNPFSRIKVKPFGSYLLTDEEGITETKLICTPEIEDPFLDTSWLELHLEQFLLNCKGLEKSKKRSLENKSLEDTIIKLHQLKTKYIF